MKLIKMYFTVRDKRDKKKNNSVQKNIKEP